MGTSIHFSWSGHEAVSRRRTGVCLHGHTMHSQECLNFLPGYLHRVPGISGVVSYYERGPAGVDFARAWWTPPLSPAAALHLEREQIVRLGLRPMVSITDHDDIQAGLSLSVTESVRRTPISVEWTVPYSGTYLHLGVHNMPREAASGWMAAMTAYTAAPAEAALPELLRELTRDPATLLVLNHPFWLEEGVSMEAHRPALDLFLRQCLPFVHAFELNGTRKWRENSDTIELARCLERPLISGGDRHGCEPAACLNLTSADTFAGFAQEIREGSSAILVMPHYREPMAQRILETSRDILADYPEYPRRRRWIDRVFYRCQDGAARSLAELWNGEAPSWLGVAARLVDLGATRRFRPALRLLTSARGELNP